MTSLKSAILLLLVTFNLSGFSQTEKDASFYLIDSAHPENWMEEDANLVDSVLTIYHDSDVDTIRINALHWLCEKMMHDDWTKYEFLLYDLLNDKLTNSDKLSEQELHFYKDKFAYAHNNVGLIYNNTGDLEKSMEYYKRSISLYKEIGNEKDMGNPLCNIGLIHNNTGELDSALKYYEKGADTYRLVDDLAGLALAINNMGAIYDSKGDIIGALKYYHESLKIYEDSDDYYGIALVLNNIGAIYKNQGEIDKALDYWNRSLKIREESNDVFSIAYSVTNLASLYAIKKDTTKAIEYLNRGLKIREELDEKRGMAQSLNLLGRMYLSMNKLDSAATYLNRSLQIRRALEDNEGLVISLNSLASLSFKQKNLNLAKKYALESKSIAQDIGFPSSIRDASKMISKISRSQGLWQEAFLNLELYILMKDSISNEENIKGAFQKEAQHKFEKQADSLAAEQLKKDVLLIAEQKRKDDIAEKEAEKKNLIIWTGSGGFLLVFLFTGFVVNRLRVTREQKSIIEDQKKQVDHAFGELEEKNTEILDSINYAKRIQKAILPSNKVVKEYLNESFILYKPKDIVAGDFYWMEHMDDTVLFAAADCTGHGVPGAMVSVICNNGLNRSVREHGLTDPGEILDKTREIVIQEFEKSEDEVKDGMDIALCSLSNLDEEGVYRELKYAGAHNPLWIIRNGELIETRANKQPIGKFEKQEPYKTHSFKLEKGDTFYIFSDGFADQFGGDRGKKYKSKRFRSFLISMQDKSMDTQCDMLNSEFEKWKGELEQIDDVCIIGVRV